MAIRGHHPQAGGGDRDFDPGAGGMGFAVGVDKPGGRAFDGEGGAPPAAHPPAAIKIAQEKAAGQAGGAEPAHRRHRQEIEAAIVAFRPGGDDRAIAILVGVGRHRPEQVESNPLRPRLENTALGPVPGECGQGGAEVGGQPAAQATIEALADFGVEAEAHDIEKRMPVRLSGIDRHDTGGRVDRQPEGGRGR